EVRCPRVGPVALMAAADMNRASPAQAPERLEVMAAVASRLGLLAPLLHIGGGMARGIERVLLAAIVRLGFRFFHEPACGFLHAEAPIDRRRAPRDVGLAGVGAVFARVERCAVAAAGSAGRGGGQRRHDFGGRHQPEPLELVDTREPAGIRLVDGDVRKIRRIFFLEVEAAGDARGTTRVYIGAGTALQACAEVSFHAAGDRQPRLKTARRSREQEKHRGATRGSLSAVRASSWMNVLSAPTGRTMRLCRRRVASSSMRGRVRARSARDMPRRKRCFSARALVHVTSKQAAPTLAWRSRIARPSACPLSVQLSVMAPGVSFPYRYFSC